MKAYLLIVGVHVYL